MNQLNVINSTIGLSQLRCVWEKEESKQIVSRPVGNSMRGESKAFVQTVIGQVNGDDDNVTRQQGKWGRSPADSL